MGLFKQKIGDIRKALERLDFVAAKTILEQHIKSDLDFKSDLALLQAAIVGYQDELRQLSEMLEATSDKQTARKRSVLPELLTAVTGAKNRLFTIKVVLSKLKKEEILLE